MAYVGRQGERRSLDYEQARVGKRPEWHSIESNKSGFDLLSLKDVGNSTELQIEVKASEQPVASAQFHITRNEWEVAGSAPHYVFHIWSLTTNPKLAVLTPEIVNEHIPTENGRGKWESVVIPYAAFNSFSRRCRHSCCDSLV
jgi:hypothetical protein